MVRVRAGSYGDQNFTARTNTGAQIAFRADGGMVRFGTVNMNGADRISFYGPYAGTAVRANSCVNSPTQCLLSRNIVWVGLTLDLGWTDNKAVDLMGAAVGWTFRDFDICCSRNDKIVNIDNFYGSDGANPNGLQANQSTDMVFEYGSVHSQVVDFHAGMASDVHTECFWFLGPQSLVMRGVHSYGCNGTMNMNFGDSGDALMPGNLTIESSVFEPSMNDDGEDQGCVAQLATNNALVGKNILRNNIFQQAFCVTNNGPSRDVMVANNVGVGPGCGRAGWVYMKNRFSNGACSASDTGDGAPMQTSYYSDAPKSDAQRNNSAAGALVKGNWAYTGAGPHVGIGDGSQCGPWSMARTQRPIGACDQGAQQFGGTSGIVVGTANFTRTGTTFDAAASVDPDGTIAEYRWTFNGVQQNTPSPTLTHAVATGDIVTLAVVDNAGNVSGLKTIRVL